MARLNRARLSWARLIAVAALLLATGGVGVLAAGPATAAACSSPSGVTVVVDFGSLGGTSVGCAQGPRSGIAALQATGHSVTYVPRQPGLVCTIDRRPDPCNGAPTTAYWSYWHATPGGSWVYSTAGAGTYQPKAGSVEGWAFGAGKPPSTRPAAAKPKPSPKPSTSSTTHRSTATSSSKPASSGSTAASGAGATSASTPRSGTTTTAAAGGSSSPSRAATAGVTETDDGTTTPAVRTDATVPTSASSDSGGTASLVIAGLLVLLLAGAGGVLARRRRGSEG